MGCHMTPSTQLSEGEVGRRCVITSILCAVTSMRARTSRHSRRHNSRRSERVVVAAAVVARTTAFSSRRVTRGLAVRLATTTASSRHSRQEHFAVPAYERQSMHGQEIAISVAPCRYISLVQRSNERHVVVPTARPRCDDDAARCHAIALSLSRRASGRHIALADQVVARAVAVASGRASRGSGVRGGGVRGGGVASIRAPRRAGGCVVAFRAARRERLTRGARVAPWLARSDRATLPLAPAHPSCRVASRRVARSPVESREGGVAGLASVVAEGVPRGGGGGGGGGGWVLFL